MNRWVTLLVLGSFVACSSSESDSGTNGRNQAAEQACLDTAVAVAKAAERCGQSYQANYDAFIAAATKGTCADILQVRDEATLRQICIPYFATASCSDVLAGKTDPSCAAQLLRASSTAPGQALSAGDEIGAEIVLR